MSPSLSLIWPRDLCSLDTARLSVKVAVIVFVVNASQINFLSEISRETVSHFRMGEMKGFRLELQERPKLGVKMFWNYWIVAAAVRLAFHSSRAANLQTRKLCASAFSAADLHWMH